MPYKTQYRVGMKRAADIIIAPSAFHNWIKTNGEDVSHTFRGRREQLERFVWVLGHQGVVTDWEIEDIFT